MRVFSRAARTFVAIGVMALSQVASGALRVETLHWAHSDPASIDGFEVVYGTSPGVYDTTIDVGYTFSHELQIDDSQNYYAAIVTYKDSDRSIPSNERAFLTTDPQSSPDDPPPPSFTEDFEGGSPGQAVPNWVDTQANFSLNVDDALFGVQNLSGSQVLFTDSGSTDIHSHYQGAPSGNWANYESRGRLRVSSSSSGVGITSHSEYATADAYFSLAREPNDEFRLYFRPEGSACDGATTGVNPSAGAWYRFRVEVRDLGSSTLVRAKVWNDGSSEPTAWQVSCVDFGSARPDAGAIGAWAAGSGSKYWDDLEVAFVPEPSSAFASAAGLLACLGLVARRRRAQR